MAAKTKNKARAVRLLIRPTATASGAVRITVAGKPETYLLTLVQSQWGEGFNFRKLHDCHDKQTAHDVHLSASGIACDCRGFEYRGSCRHADAVVALRKHGQL